MRYGIGFGLLVLFFCGAMLFFRRVHALAWWEETHTGLVREAILRLALCGETEAAAFFSGVEDGLREGAAAPDRSGDPDSALSGGAHYCLVPRAWRQAENGALADGLFAEEPPAPYLKRAGALWDVTGVLRARSPYLKSAFTIAEENYMTALFYAVRFRTGGEQARDLAFAADCLGRALHGLSDAAAIPHCVGKRYIGKGSYHYRFERFAAEHMPFREKGSLSPETGFLLQTVRSRSGDASFCGSFIRRAASTLAVRSARRYGKERTAVREASVCAVLSETADACAAVLLLFFLEMTATRSVPELLTGREDAPDGSPEGRELPERERPFQGDGPARGETICLSVLQPGEDPGKGVRVRLSLCDDFPAFTVSPAAAGGRSCRAFSGRFRIVRSEAGRFYITVSRRGFRRILRIGRAKVRTAPFFPEKRKSFVEFCKTEREKR